MLDFWEYLDLEQLLNENFDKYQPLNGRWTSPLTEPPASFRQYVYNFDVPGDQCRLPCYTVKIGGEHENGTISISFSREGSYSDVQKGVGVDVFKGVLKALSEYFSVHKPAKVEWSAVSKSRANPRTGKISNPEARSHIYEQWALRFLFPDRYVGMSGNWIRRDIYDEKYVPLGYPPVPENLNQESSPGLKRKAYEEMKQKVEAKKEELERADREREAAEIQRRAEEAAEEERRYQEFLAQQIANPEINPEGIQVGDIVYVVDPESVNLHNKPGSVEGFDMSRNGSDFFIKIRFAGNEWEEKNFTGVTKLLQPSRLKKETPQIKEERIRKLEEKKALILSDPEKNPNNIQVGDEIITWVINSQSQANGLMGRVKSIYIDPWTRSPYARVDWASEGSESKMEYHMQLKNFQKATPEKIAEIRRKMRELEINHRVSASRAKWQARARRAEGGTSEVRETPEDIINHPQNPLHLKIGDFVRVRNPTRYGRQARRTNFAGVITDIRKYGSGDGEYLGAYVRYHGSNARRLYHTWNVPNDLERDETPETQQYIARQQARQRRAQRAVGNTGGHQVGDVVTVLTGRHRGKSGHIVNFRYVGDNVSAIITPTDGPDFSVNIRMLQPPASTPQPTAESFSFRDYLLYFESLINRV